MLQIVSSNTKAEYQNAKIVSDETSTITGGTTTTSTNTGTLDLVRREHNLNTKKSVGSRSTIVRKSRQ